MEEYLRLSIPQLKYIHNTKPNNIDYEIDSICRWYNDHQVMRQKPNKILKWHPYFKTWMKRTPTSKMKRIIRLTVFFKIQYQKDNNTISWKRIEIGSMQQQMNWKSYYAKNSLFQSHCYLSYRIYCNKMGRRYQLKGKWIIGQIQNAFCWATFSASTINILQHQRNMQSCHVIWKFKMDNIFCTWILISFNSWCY